MKNILKSSLFLALLAIAGCTDTDKDPAVSLNGFKLNQPATTNITLTPQQADADLLTLSWEPANYGTPSVASYTIEVAQSGTNFASPITAVSSTDPITGLSYTWKAGFLNSVLNQIGFAPCESLDVDVRVKSTLGLNPDKAVTQYSSVVTLHVTPYSSALPTLAFSDNGTITDDTPKLAASSLTTTDYEGYVRLTAGIQYRFYMPSSCGSYANPTVYGDDDSGSFDTLTANGSAYQVATSGLYLVKANFPAGGPFTYSVTPITAWGVIGDAKVIGTGNSLPAMTYDPVAKVYNVTLPLKGGKNFKFRANNNNVITLGKFDPAKTGAEYAGPVMSYNGQNIQVPGLSTETFTYKVTLDLNQPRNYTYTFVRQ